MLAFCKMLGLVALLMTGSAYAVDLHDPYKMMNEVASRTFETIQANHARLSDRAYRINLIRTELMPYVDTKYVSYKVIGNNLQATSEQERASFTTAFESYMINAFADALGKYDQQVLVSPEYRQVGADEKMTNIKFLIREAGKPDLELLFKLRRNSKTGEWKVFDLVAENISMLQAKQSELGPLIRERGIAAVTQLLQEKN